MSVGDAILIPELETTDVDADNPWPGLLPFTEADAAYFQGRDAETEELLRLILRERVTVLFGLSGLGKSSLLQAGLFPRLRDENVFPVYIRLDFSAQRPDLIAQVKEAISREAAASRIEAAAPQEGETLWEYFHRKDADFWNRKNRPVVPLLVFDQFEEIFTLGRRDPERAEAVEEFLNELVDLAEGRPPTAVKERLDDRPEEAGRFSFGRHHYKILLALREDFLPDLEALRERIGAVALNRFRLRRMNGEAAFLVVHQATHLIDPQVAEEVVRRVAAARTGAVLKDLEIDPALLSFVCRELNNKRRQTPEPKITASLLDANYEGVIQEFYGGSFIGLDPRVRSFVEEKLLTVAGYRDSVALDNALSVPGVSREAIERLVSRRLLRIEDRGAGQRLELTHDLLTKVVRSSRDRRHEAEAAELALREAQEREQNALAALQQERERAALRAAQEREKAARLEVLEREQREAAALQQARRTRWAAAVMLLFGLVACGAAVLAVFAQRKAIIAAAEAASEREIAIRLANESKAAEARAKEAEARAREAEKKAKEEESDAIKQRGIAVQEEKKARTALAGSAVEDASHFVEADRPDQALGHLARALRVDPDSVAARNWISDLVLRKSWWFPGAPLQHQQLVYSAAFSPDGRRVVTASLDNTARVWEVDTGKPVALLQHQERVNSAAFSPDGRRVVTASLDRTARVWEAETGKPVGIRLQHEGEVRSAAFSRNGRRVVTASGDKTAQVWEAETGKPVGAPLQHEGLVSWAAFSEDGRRVVTGSLDKTARVWEAETGKPVGAPLQHQYAVSSAGFSPDGRRVVTASQDRTARVWETETGKPVGAPLQHQDMVLSAAFSPDGRRVVTASLDRTARVWEADNGKSVTLQHQDKVLSAAFSPDGRRVVTASVDQTARVWEADTGKPEGAPMQHQNSVSSAAFSPDGRRVVTASGVTARVWEADAGKPVSSSLQHQDTVFHAVFSPDGRRVVTASDDKTARLWEADTGKPVGAPLQHKGPVRFATFSSDGRRVVTASADNTARAWEADTGKAAGAPQQQQGAAIFAAFSPDGRRVVTFALMDLAARVWEVDTGKPVGAPLQHQYLIFSAAFSPDGRRVVTASADKTARVWEADTGKPVGAPLRHQAEVYFAAFGPDRRRVITASDDHTARVWEADTGKPVGAPLQHHGPVRFAAFSPDGRRVVTASYDNTARVWEADTGKPVGTPLQHQNAVLSATFSPDGRRVVTASADHTARVWGILLGSGSREDTARMADLAEAVGGYQVNELGSLVFIGLDAQRERLNKLRRLADQAPNRGNSINSFIRQFLPVAR